MPPLKKSEIIKLLPSRDPYSHKGDNGRVLIIGGSLDYFGAPLLSASAALHSGADLVYLLVPECNFEVSRSFYPDFIVRKYPGTFLNNHAFAPAQELLKKSDCVLIGPGISEHPQSTKTITDIIKKTSCPIVLDAEAIPAIAEFGLPENRTGLPPITITPHHGEMDELVEESLPQDREELALLVEDFAQKWNVTILLKGPHDLIVAPDHETRDNATGNQGMTVGGTGDVLAGLVASLIAQGASSYEAALCTAFINGTAGDRLYEKKGFNFIASELALELSHTIKALIG